MKKHLSVHAMMWANYKEEQKRRRAYRVPLRIAEINSLRGQFKIKVMIPPTKFRFNDCLEVDVVHNNYFDIKTKKRGIAPNLTDFITNFFKTNERKL